MTSVFRATWRTIVVGFCSVYALVEVALTMRFIGHTRRLRARAEWLHRWSSLAVRVIGIRIATRGEMPQTGLLVSNHLSYIDVIVLSSICPCIFVAKRDIARWPLFGWLTRAAGAIFVDRERKLAAVSALERMREAIDRGLLVVLFPEATSSDGSSVLPFKSALLQPAVQIGSPIAAAAINYALEDGSVTDEVCYWRDMTLVPHLLNLFSKREIHAICTFSLPRVRVGDRKQIAQELRHEIVSMRFRS
jgi:1-acyl-sn-glycerol-3-phosphate acyltransferase